MKKIFLVFFLAAITCTLTYAQKKDTTSTRIKKNVAGARVKKTTDTTAARMHKKSPMKQVGLSKDQEAKIKTANKDFKNKSQKVKKDSTLTDAQKKTKLKELNKEKKKQVDTVLTADQKNKLKEIHKQNKANSPQKTKPSPKTKTAG